MEAGDCQKYCGGRSDWWNYTTLMASMYSGQSYSFTWCMPTTGNVWANGAVSGAPWSQIYIYQDNVKITTGLTSSISATTECCSGSTYSGQFGYLLYQPEGGQPTPPLNYGNLVLFNNFVTNNVDTLTGFSMNNIDVISANTNNSCSSISGLTQYGGQIYFTQNGNTAVYSGTSSSFTTNSTGFTGSSLTLVQSAGIPFNTASTVNVGFFVTSSPFKGTTGITSVNACTLWNDPLNRIAIFASSYGPIVDNVTSLYYDVNLTIPVTQGIYVSDGFNAYSIGTSGKVTTTLICV
jgi:hypothetical protein